MLSTTFLLDIWVELAFALWLPDTLDYVYQCYHEASMDVPYIDSWERGHDDGVQIIRFMIHSAWLNLVMGSSIKDFVPGAIAGTQHVLNLVGRCGAV